VRLLVSPLAGSLTAIATAVVIPWALEASPEALASLAPKSVTTPIAMAISKDDGGSPALTVVLVILTGIIGAVSVTPLMNLSGLKDFATRGLAAGLASHSIRTARVPCQ